MQFPPIVLKSVSSRSWSTHTLFGCMFLPLLYSRWFSWGAHKFTSLFVNRFSYRQSYLVYFFNRNIVVFNSVIIFSFMSLLNFSNKQNTVVNYLKTPYLLTVNIPTSHRLVLIYSFSHESPCFLTLHGWWPLSRCQVSVTTCWEVCISGSL